MLTESQYKELVRYRSGDIPDDGSSNETIQFLYRKKYIIRYWSRDSGKHNGPIMRAITDPGRQALEEFEEYVESERKEQAARDRKESADKNQVALDSRKETKHELVVTIVASTVSGLILLAIQNFPSIIQFFKMLLQRFTP